MTALPNTRKVRATGTKLTVGTVDMFEIEAGADGEKYAAICDDHSTHVLVKTRKAMFDIVPTDFCEACRELVANPLAAEPKAPKAKVAKEPSAAAKAGNQAAKDAAAAVRAAFRAKAEADAAGADEFDALTTSNPSDDFDAPADDIAAAKTKLTPGQKSFLGQVKSRPLEVARTDTGTNRTVKALVAKGLVTVEVTDDGQLVTAV